MVIAVSTTLWGVILGGGITGVVSVAGNAFQWLQGRDARESAVELAEVARQHETALRRADRTYEGKTEAYRSALRFARHYLDIVFLTEPILSQANDPNPPENPPEEDLRWAQVEVGLFGTSEAVGAFRSYVESLQHFYREVDALRAGRDQQQKGIALPPGQSLGALYGAVQDARQEVLDEYAAFAQCANEDIASD